MDCLGGTNLWVWVPRWTECCLSGIRKYHPWVQYLFYLFLFFKLECPLLLVGLSRYLYMHFCSAYEFVYCFLCLFVAIWVETCCHYQLGPGSLWAGIFVGRDLLALPAFSLSCAPLWVGVYWIMTWHPLILTNIAFAAISPIILGLLFCFPNDCRASMAAREDRMLTLSGGFCGPTRGL